MAGYYPLPPTAGSGTTWGALTNTEILALSPEDNDTAWSTDDYVEYTYYQGTWFNPVGGAI